MNIVDSNLHRNNLPDIHNILLPNANDHMVVLPSFNITAVPVDPNPFSNNRSILKKHRTTKAPIDSS